MHDGHINLSQACAIVADETPHKCGTTSDDANRRYRTAWMIM
jgi:hypothetical protein